MAQVSVKFEAKRFEEDRSNIEEFVEFIGGIVYKDSEDDEPTAAIESDDYITFIHPGDYAIKLADGTVQKWYKADFEELFSI